MKILLVTFTFHPEGNGVSEVASIHAFGLARRGHDVTVVCSRNERRNLADYPANLKVVEFVVPGSANIKYGFSGEVEQYRQFIATFPCDVILLQGWNFWATEAAFAVLDRNPAKKVLVSHGYAVHLWCRHPKFPWGLGQWLGWQPFVWSFPKHVRMLDHIVFLSYRKDTECFFDRTLMDLLGKKKWSAIFNGASIRSAPSELPDFRKQFGIAPDEKILLNVANLCDRKNQIGALRSFVEANLEKAVLVFVASEINEYGARLQAVLRDLQPRICQSRVLILTGLSKKEIFAAYHAADLFVFSSVLETQPLAIIDAMACGVPFVALDTGCISEMPGGVVLSSENQMANALRKLTSDSVLRSKLGQEGREAVDKSYNWESNLDRYEDLLTKLVTGADRPV